MHSGGDGRPRKDTSRHEQATRLPLSLPAQKGLLSAFLTVKELGVQKWLSR